MLALDKITRRERVGEGKSIIIKSTKMKIKLILIHIKEP